MASKINHVAIMSTNYTLEYKFYETYFGMKNSAKAQSTGSAAIGDGHVGLNINPRRAGRPGRFDHFGIQVDDLDATMEKLGQYGVKVLKRPVRRPFANYSTHDPDCNVFDLTEAGGDNIKGVYANNNWEQDSTISHLGLRTVHAEQMAEFYIEAFDFKLTNGPVPEGGYGVTDGRMTLMIMQWDLDDYADMGIVGPGLDYLGFKVKSIEAFKKDVAEISANNPLLAPSPVGTGREGAKRLEMLRRTSIGSYHIADPDGVLIDITE
jgi:catechol 2,3-dioxygenase-like lactoylglutathione lyase family enzyme